MSLQAPFPWFGGKSRVSAQIWARLGDVANYVEPFAGSLAVLLGRPARHGGRIETVNDLDGFVANFWRAVAADPQATARWADAPVNENDLHARHAWLVEHRARLTRRLEGDPDFFDARIAGWWAWGACVWIGAGWCSGGDGPWQVRDGELVAGPPGSGVARQLPHLGDGGKGVNRSDDIAAWFAALAARLRRVRVACGDWSRVTGESVTTRHGLTGVVLDPPYSGDIRKVGVYAVDAQSLAQEVRAWCAQHGGDPQLRIALCGYSDAEGHEQLEELGWDAYRWRARGGYCGGRGGRGDHNRALETVWFSPHCAGQQVPTLFDAVAAG